MITTVLCDFSRVLLKTKDPNVPSYSGLYRDLMAGKIPGTFFDHFELNVELLDYLKQLQNTFQLFMFTDSQLPKAPEISAQLAEVFAKNFFAEDLGLDKQDPYAYQFVCNNKIGINPSRVIFIDDKDANLKAARLAGLNTVKYENNKQVISELNTIST